QRAAVGGFNDLTQLAGIGGLTGEALQTLLRAFTRTVYGINTIQFSYHDGSLQHDGLHLRSNFAQAAPSPRWQRGAAIPDFRQAPAGYAIKESLGQVLALRIALQANGLGGAFVRATGGGVLGPVREQFVSFDADGQSGLQTFQLTGPTFHQSGVGAHDVTFNWQWRTRKNEAWRELLVTRHRVYIVLEAPTLPWTQTPTSTALPWTDALELACTWAAGATTRTEAARRIAERYFDSGRVAYDTASGATFYGIVHYNLTEMLERLNGGVGLGAKVNCTDSANTVSTLSNLLGCDLWQSRMGSAFALNAVISIGFRDWALPFGGGFSYHEVAWSGACAENDNVFDACLKVDGDPDPTRAPRSALLPVDMRFGDGSALDYRQRLCPPTPNGSVKCQPQPAEHRRRRPII
ncbi:MAG: hypothetical protein ABW321_09465, partial [Polyangiales bacterium]